MPSDSEDDLEDLGFPLTSERSVEVTGALEAYHRLLRTALQSSENGDLLQSQAPPTHAKRTNKLRWIWKKFLQSVACFLFIHVILLALSYFEVWDPCGVVQVPSGRSCSSHFLLHPNLLTYTDFKEDFYCLLPGTSLHKRRRGWNLDIQC